MKQPNKAGRLYRKRSDDGAYDPSASHQQYWKVLLSEASTILRTFDDDARRLAHGQLWLATAEKLAGGSLSVALTRAESNVLRKTLYDAVQANWHREARRDRELWLGINVMIHITAPLAALASEIPNLQEFYAWFADFFDSSEPCDATDPVADRYRGEEEGGDDIGEAVGEAEAEPGDGSVWDDEQKEK